MATISTTHLEAYLLENLDKEDVLYIESKNILLSDLIEKYIQLFQKRLLVTSQIFLIIFSLFLFYIIPGFVEARFFIWTQSHTFLLILTLIFANIITRFILQKNTEFIFKKRSSTAKPRVESEYLLMMIAKEIQEQRGVWK